MRVNYKKCDSNKLGTGLADCMAELGLPVGFIRVPRNWTMDVETEDLDQAYITEQIQKQDFIPFVGATNYAPNTGDPTYQDYDNGVSSFIRNGKPSFDFSYERGKIWHTIASSYNTNKKDAVLLVYSNGSVQGALSPDETTLSGFRLSFQNAGTYIDESGAEAGKTTIRIQLVNEVEFNTNVAIITKDELGFDIVEDIPEVNDAILLPQDATAGEPLNVSVVFRVNRGEKVLGLLATDFRLIVNNTSAPIDSVAYDDVNEWYVITPTTAFAADDSVYVELYDADNAIAVANSGDMLFKGKSTAVTVAAAGA